MGVRAVTTVIRFRESDWRHLQQHLLRGDGDEHGAVLLCGTHQQAGRTSLVVRDVQLALDGIDYVPGQRGYRHLTGEFVTRQVRRAKDLGLAYLAVHNHPGRGPVQFSTSDLDSHKRGYPTLRSLLGNIVGALVLSETAIAGEIWYPDGVIDPLDFATVVGDTLTDYNEQGTCQRGLLHSVDHVAYHRQSLIFGASGQRLLSQLTVGIVGLGGVGMLLAQTLGRLGVGSFILIDPDRVSLSNLSRLPEADLADAIGRWGDGPLGRFAATMGRNQPTLKINLAYRIISRANKGARIESHAADVADDEVARKLSRADFIFLAADSMMARNVVNQLAYQFLIPGLQVGSKVTLDRAGRVLDVFGAVRPFGTEPGCLDCNGLIDAARLTEESLANEEQRRNQRYVDDADIVAPSVITINAMSSGWAANDFMQFATGIGGPTFSYKFLRSRPQGRTGVHTTVQAPIHDPGCHVCSLQPQSAFARGDGWELPTRI